MNKDLTQLSVDETVLLNVRKRQRGISTTYIITATQINYFQDRLSRLERIERELKELAKKFVWMQRKDINAILNDADGKKKGGEV